MLLLHLATILSLLLRHGLRIHQRLLIRHRLLHRQHGVVHLILHLLLLVVALPRSRHPLLTGVSLLYPLRLQAEVLVLSDLTLIHIIIPCIHLLHLVELVLHLARHIILQVRLGHLIVH